MFCFHGFSLVYWSLYCIHWVYWGMFCIHLGTLCRSSFKAA